MNKIVEFHNSVVYCVVHFNFHLNDPPWYTRFLLLILERLNGLSYSRTQLRTFISTCSPALPNPLLLLGPVYIPHLPGVPPPPTRFSLWIACEQALLFGRASGERASEGPRKLSFPLPPAASPLARAFSRDSLRSPNRRACSQASLWSGLWWPFHRLTRLDGVTRLSIYLSLLIRQRLHDWWGNPPYVTSPI